jgi:hypothetical protein
LVEDTRDHHLLDDAGGDDPDLKARVHLLTEENQALFEQVTLLRAHCDSFNREAADKIMRAEEKAAAYDLLEGQVARLIEERD